MTNKIYYQSKNPIACIAFANWIKHNFLSTISRENNLYIPRTFGIEESKVVSINKPYDTVELYQIWENLEVDKTLAKDEITNQNEEYSG